jgi:thiol-disulfide isomerase/thioredoxin
MIDVKDMDEYLGLIKSSKAVCALFTAQWCPDCQALKPIMPDLEEEYKELCDFISLDRDAFIDLCQEKDIYGIPSFIVFQDGLELGRFVSKDAKTKAEIDAFLKKTLKI